MSVTFESHPVGMFAAYPIAVLLDHVPLLWRAPNPLAVLLDPVVLA